MQYLCFPNRPKARLSVIVGVKPYRLGGWPIKLFYAALPRESEIFHTSRGVIGKLSVVGGRPVFAPATAGQISLKSWGCERSLWARQWDLSASDGGGRDGSLDDG